MTYSLCTGCNITLPSNATDGNCNTTSGLKYNSSCTFACQSSYEAPAGTGLTFECGDNGTLTLNPNAACIRSMCFCLAPMHPSAFPRISGFSDDMQHAIAPPIFT